MKISNARILAVTLSVFGITAHAEYFPTKPITLVVPFSAGGPTDKVTRDLALIMGKKLGQPIIVENTVGAGGTIGSRKVATAQKDGYTLLVHTTGMSTASSLYKKLGYNPLKDFDYIGQIVDVPMVLLGGQNFAPKNLMEAMKFIRSNPGKVTIGHAGPGSAAHLCTLLFERELKAPMVSVAYKGSAPALSDVIGGQIDLVCDQTTSTIGHLQSGTVKPLAITTSKRVPPFDSLATADEQGLKGFSLETWHGMYAPRGTPPAILNKLVATLQDSVKDPGFIMKMKEMGAQAVTVDKATPKSLETKLISESERWNQVIRDAGIKPN